MDSENLSRAVYIYRTPDAPHDWLSVTCNYCASHVFYEGEDTSLPDSDWIADVVQHLVENHASRLT